MKASQTQWPKRPPELNAQQQEAREKYMRLWHDQLPKKYASVEAFNHGFSTKLPLKPHSRTLEVGAGIGEHAKFEDLLNQEYHCLEFREEFCNEIKKSFPAERVHRGDIHQKQPWPAHHFDRIVAIHVLEHLLNLPLAIAEILRLLKQDGVFDIVIPCEGGLAHRTGRKLTAERLFHKHFDMDFSPILRNEHVSTFPEIMAVLNEHFEIQKSSYFPFKAPVYWMNFVAGFRLSKKNRTAFS